MDGSSKYSYSLTSSGCGRALAAPSDVSTNIMGTGGVLLVQIENHVANRKHAASASLDQVEIKKCQYSLDLSTGVH